MEFFKTGFVVMATALSACAGTVALKVPDGTSYYLGESAFFSPDGRLPYGKTDSAVKREILAGGARIIETVTQPGAGPGVPPKTMVTELKRRGKKLVYDASDAGGTFSGTLTYKDAGLTGWTYDLRLKNGGAIKGKGSVSAGGLKTEKQLTGGRPMLVKDELKPVSEEKYNDEVRAMKPGYGAE